MVINKLLTKVNYRNTNNLNRIKYIVIHYVGATGGAEDNCHYFHSVNRGASAHYFVGHEGEIWQCVDDADVAWHCGDDTYWHDTCRNDNSIGIEMCCRKNASGVWYFEDVTVASTIELTKELMKKYNVPAENVIRHYDVTGKVCPAPYVNNNTKHTWDAFKKGITGAYTPVVKPAEPANKKSVTEIAKEVINGKWGNGSVRETKLTAAGYNYDEVQDAVNDILLGKKPSTNTTTTTKPTTPAPTPAKKTVEQIAREVINGKWGNGDAREAKLVAAGYNYDEVQDMVNCILLGKKPATSTTAPAKKTVDQIAREVIQGKWGNGAARREKLEAAGYNYSDVQDRVNELL